MRKPIKKQKVISNEDKFERHIGCPRCGGTRVILTALVNDPREYKEGYVESPCHYYGGWYRKTERALAYAGVEAPSRN